MKQGFASCSACGTLHGNGNLLQLPLHIANGNASSIGTNIREAQYAHGKADFIAKLQIALKEANETGY